MMKRLKFGFVPAVFIYKSESKRDFNFGSFFTILLRSVGVLL